MTLWQQFNDPSLSRVGVKCRKVKSRRFDGSYFNNELLNADSDNGEVIVIVVKSRIFNGSYFNYECLNADINNGCIYRANDIVGLLLK